MANNFKNVIDRQMWVQVAPAPNAHAAGVSLCSDLRNALTRNPFVYQLVSNTVLNRFNIVTKGWEFVRSPALGGTFGAGAGAVFAPSLSLVGAVAAGSSTTSVTTSTTITAVGVNMLANRGGSGGYGYKVRIIGKSAGGSGKTEERWIVGNTEGTTPTLTLESALTFTPAAGDAYEILGGRVFMMGASTLAAGMWKSFEVASNTLSGNLSTTNMPATVSTDFSAVVLDEQYVPYDALPGEGFVTGAGTYDGVALKCLIATASASGTITGQATAGDASVLLNEYRNFQIRIVEDTAIPTAVGQRRIIASHTAGASPVYTLGAAWTVTPSATAKFVIEYPNLILVRSSATAVVYTYNYSGAAINNGTATINNDAWHVTYFGNAPAVMAGGCTTIPSFGISPEAAKRSRHSFIYCFRGGAVVTLDMLDIAGGVAGAWSTAIVYDNPGVTVTVGSCGKYAPAAAEGRYAYINCYVASAVNQLYRFDVKNRVLNSWTPPGYIQAGTAVAGDRLVNYVAIDGSDKYTVTLLLGHTAANAMEMIVQI